MRSTIFHFSSYSQYHFYQSNSEVSLVFLSCMILSKKKKTKHARERKLKLPNHLITSSTSSLLKNANGLNFVSKKTFAAKLIGGSFSDYIKKPHLSTLKLFFKQQAKVPFPGGERANKFHHL